MSASNKQVFVIGCPRSGTSPFARWLHACGLSTVADERRHERYPEGYFEHTPVTMFHRALNLLPRGSDYVITLEPYLRSELLSDPYVAATFQLAFQPMLRRQIEFLKYPQLALSTDFLFEHFPGIHIVAVWRDPVATFRSLVTNEFPPEMRATSGVRSILLWSLYAHHVVNARRSHPEQVTVLNIDDFLTDPAAGAKVMERIGRPPDSAVPAEQVVDRALWRRPVGPGWRLYHLAMKWTCRALRGQLGEPERVLTDQKHWERELRRVSDL